VHHEAHHSESGKTRSASRDDPYFFTSIRCSNVAARRNPDHRSRCVFARRVLTLPPDRLIHQVNGITLTTSEDTSALRFRSPPANARNHAPTMTPVAIPKPSRNANAKSAFARRVLTLPPDQALGEVEPLRQRRPETRQRHPVRSPPANAPNRPPTTTGASCYPDVATRRAKAPPDTLSPAVPPNP